MGANGSTPPRPNSDAGGAEGLGRPQQRPGVPGVGDPAPAAAPGPGRASIAARPIRRALAATASRPGGVSRSESRARVRSGTSEGGGAARLRARASHGALAPPARPRCRRVPRSRGRCAAPRPAGSGPRARTGRARAVPAGVRSSRTRSRRGLCGLSAVGTARPSRRSRHRLAEAYRPDETGTNGGDRGAGGDRVPGCASAATTCCVMLGQHKPWGWLHRGGPRLPRRARRAARLRSEPPAGAGQRDQSRRVLVRGHRSRCGRSLLPARWVFGSCIVAAEIALVFDLITLAAPRRAAGGN